MFDIYTKFESNINIA